jgi:hypothetical protein
MFDNISADIIKLKEEPEKVPGIEKNKRNWKLLFFQGKQQSIICQSANF